MMGCVCRAQAYKVKEHYGIESNYINNELTHKSAQIHRISVNVHR